MRACKEALPLAVWCRSIGIYLGRTRFASWAGPEIQSMGAAMDEDAGRSQSADPEATSTQTSSAAPLTTSGEQVPIDNRSSLETGGLLVTPDLTRLSPRDLQQVSE